MECGIDGCIRIIALSSGIPQTLKKKLKKIVLIGNLVPHTAAEFSNSLKI